MSAATAAFVAHELRAPLALQHALVEVALADPDADASALRQMGERVLAGCKQQQRLIDALLLLARGGALTGREPLDLAAIATGALRAHDPGGLEILASLEPARTTGDPNLLERLAANLVSNAIRHNIPGGRIDLATRTEAERAVLSVANSGPLIPSGALQRLFQPFQRLDPRSRFPDEGVGLGLTIVEAIAAAHCARVSARARAGGGLEIDVSFPAEVAAAGEGGARRSAVAVSSRSGG